jgi:hypothetical protein
MQIVERNFDQLLNWERGIRQENLSESYKKERLIFLESLLDKYTHNTDNLLKLIEWVKTN